MTLKSSIFVTALCALVSLAAFGIVTQWFSPYHPPLLAPLLFSAAVWLTVATFGSVFGVLVRLGRRHRDVEARIVARAYRQGALLATVATGALWLARAQMLTILTAIGLVVLATCLELFFLSSRREQRPRMEKISGPT